MSQFVAEINEKCFLLKDFIDKSTSELKSRKM